MKLTVIDSWRKFAHPVAEHWRSLGHEVVESIHWGPELSSNVGCCYFAQCDNNAIQASRKQPKPPGTRIVIEAVDIDIYAGHPGAINWDYVDALVVMAPHTEALVREKSLLRPGLPVHVVPGGIDLDKFTLRQQPRGFNVAWIGRFWIAKNVFGALQVFNQLIRSDSVSPWRLYLRGDGWDPLWWRKHVEAYLTANPDLKARVEFVPRVPDVASWLEDKDYLLQTSFKEAFGYVVGEAAAKGIKPIVQNTNGAQDTWPRDWVFDTHDEAVGMFLGDYDPAVYRALIADRYPLEKRLQALDEICLGAKQ